MENEEIFRIGLAVLKALQDSGLLSTLLKSMGLKTTRCRPADPSLEIAFAENKEKLEKAIFEFLEKNKK